MSPPRYSAAERLGPSTRRAMTAGFVAAMVIGAAPALAQPMGDDATQAELEALRQRVERLEAALAAGVGGEPDSERVEELETQVEDLQADLEDLQVENQEVTDALATRMDRATRVFGYTSSFLRLQDGGDLTFRGYRVNMMLDARLSANLRFFAEIEFEDAAFVGSGEADSGLVETERGFLELTFVPEFGVRAGILLASFGRFNLDHQSWRFPFSERPLVYNRIFPATYADVGVGIFGNIALGEEIGFQYRLGMINGIRDNFGRLRNGAVDFSKGLRSSRPLAHHDNNDAKSVSGRMALTIGDHVNIGASGYWGIYEDDGDADIRMGGADIWLEWTDFTLRAEGVLGYIGNSTVNFDYQEGGINMTASARTPNWVSGAYLGIEGRFMPSDWHSGPLGQFGDPGEARFFAGARGEFARIDLRDAIGTAANVTALQEFRVSASVGYRPVVESAIRLEFLYGFGNLELQDTWMAKLSFSLGY